jgi:hypothetical protein
MRGHSISEIILSDHPIGFTGIDTPHVIVALGQEGVKRRKKNIEQLLQTSMVIVSTGIDLPTCRSDVKTIDFKSLKIKTVDWALAALAWLAVHNHIITTEMLVSALKIKFKSTVLQKTLDVLNLVKSAKEKIT